MFTTRVLKEGSFEEIQHVVDAHVETICDDICVSSTSHISQHDNKSALGRTGNHMRLNI